MTWPATVPGPSGACSSGFRASSETNKNFSNPVLLGPCGPWILLFQDLGGAQQGLHLQCRRVALEGQFFRHSTGFGFRALVLGFCVCTLSDPVSCTTVIWQLMSWSCTERKRILPHRPQTQHSPRVPHFEEQQGEFRKEWHLAKPWACPPRTVPWIRPEVDSAKPHSARSQSLLTCYGDAVQGFCHPPCKDDMVMTITQLEKGTDIPHSFGQ